MTRYIVFDVETPNRYNNRISAIGISVVEDAKIIKEYFYFVNPGQRFDWFNTQRMRPRFRSCGKLLSRSWAAVSWLPITPALIWAWFANVCVITALRGNRRSGVCVLWSWAAGSVRESVTGWMTCVITMASVLIITMRIVTAGPAQRFCFGTWRWERNRKSLYEYIICGEKRKLQIEADFAICYSMNEPRYWRSSKRKNVYNKSIISLSCRSFCYKERITISCLFEPWSW